MGRVDQFGDTTEVPTISRSTTNETARNAGNTEFTGTPGSTATTDGVATLGIARPRLFRDPDERVIAGVAAGIAAYFDVSPAWIRLLFLVSLFIGGSGLVYLVPCGSASSGRAR